VGQKAGFHLVGAAQMVGLLVELRVQRDDATVRVFEFPVEVQQLVWRSRSSLSAHAPLAVLFLDLLQRATGGLLVNSLTIWLNDVLVTTVRAPAESSSTARRCRWPATI